MIYLLDANVLITAKNTYYPIDRVPEYWDWLLYQAQTEKVKMPIEIVEEILEGRKSSGEEDQLVKWLKINKESFLLKEEVNQSLLQKVVNEGFADDLTDDEIEQLKRDPFLVAYALAALDRAVVTTEVSAPSKSRQNRKLPDVCSTFSIPCKNAFDLNRELNFRTAWKESI